jgi:hypothetical protein
MASPGGRFGCYVGNIDASVPLETIRQVFAQCGTILDASLNGRDTDPYRFGFIDFANEPDRERALKFNGVVLAGRPLKVGVSKGNVNRPNSDGTTNPRSHGGAGGDGGMSESTALLVQLVQSGAVNPANLTAEQQRLLSGALLGGMGAPSMGGGMPPPPMPMMPQQPMGAPMMGGGGGMMAPQGYGGYPPQANGGGYGARPGGYRRGPPSANPPPSEELMMLRQAQRKTFFDVVTKEAERYQEKMQKRKNKRDGSRSDSDSSSSDDEGDRRHSKEHRKERSSERERRGHSGSRRDHSAERRPEHSAERRREHSGERRRETEDSRNAL